MAGGAVGSAFSWAKTFAMGKLGEFYLAYGLQPTISSIMNIVQYWKTKAVLVESQIEL